MGVHHAADSALRRGHWRQRCPPRARWSARCRASARIWRLLVGAARPRRVLQVWQAWAHLRVLRVALLQHVLAHHRHAAVLRHVQRVREAGDAAAEHLNARGAGVRPARSQHSTHSPVTAVRRAHAPESRCAPRARPRRRLAARRRRRRPKRRLRRRRTGRGERAAKFRSAGEEAAPPPPLRRLAARVLRDAPARSPRAARACTRRAAYLHGDDCQRGWLKRAQRRTPTCCCTPTSSSPSLPHTALGEGETVPLHLQFFTFLRGGARWRGAHALPPVGALGRCPSQSRSSRQRRGEASESAPRLACGHAQRRGRPAAAMAEQPQAPPGAASTPRAASWDAEQMCGAMRSSGHAQRLDGVLACRSVLTPVAAQAGRLCA